MQYICSVIYNHSVKNTEITEEITSAGYTGTFERTIMHEF